MSIVKKFAHSISIKTLHSYLNMSIANNFHTKAHTQASSIDRKEIALKTFSSFSPRWNQASKEIGHKSLVQWYFTIPYELLTSDLYTFVFECAQVGGRRRKTLLRLEWNPHLNVLQVVRQANKAEISSNYVATANARIAH